MVLLAHPIAKFRPSAAQALGEIGGNGVLGALFLALYVDRKKEFPQKIGHALGKVGNQRVIPSINQWKINKKQARQNAADQVIKQIEKRKDNLRLVDKG